MKRRRLSAEAEWLLLTSLLVIGTLLGATVVLLDAFGR
jgi:hypothetical protein